MTLFSPQWNALSREAAIAGQSISGGLAALRKANYAYIGLYSQAFFNLSIGFERLLKLIYLIDSAIENGGRYPSEADLRRDFGHDLEKLFSYAQRVHDRLPDRHSRYPIASSGIEADIVKFLSSFAKTTRYYNLDYLTGRAGAATSTDPIAEWYGNIGQRILRIHYSIKQQEKDQHSAAIMEAMIGDVSLIRHTAEDGSPLTDIRSASLRTGENKVVQKYGTFYCAKVSRFLYMVLYDLVHRAHAARLQIPYLYEFFFPFMNDDSYLLSRKTFPPRGQ